LLLSAVRAEDIDRQRRPQARQAQAARAAAAPQHRPQHGAQQQMRGLDSKSELHLSLRNHHFEK